MIFDSSDLNEDTVIDADVCIVGAGVAGISLAYKLRESGLRVLLLESGGFEYDQDIQALYVGHIAKDLPPVPLDASRLRQFGGTSNHWGGHCAPFDLIDFQKRAWIPASGWPIERAELEPYYVQTQDLIELGEYNYDPATWYADNDQLFDLRSTSLRNLVIQMHAQRFGERYKGTLLHSKNVSVLTHSNLTKIHLSEDYSRITSLEIQSLTGKTIFVRSRFTALCCGGVENARILLNAGLDKKLPNIGRYFSFHPRLETARIALQRPLERDSSPYDWTEIRENTLRLLIGLSVEAQARLKIANHAAILHLVVNPELASYSAAKRLAGKAESSSSDSLFRDLGTFLSDIGGAVDQWRHRHGNEQMGELVVVTYMDQLPCPDSRVTLNDEKDALGLRRVNVDWRYTDADVEGITKFNEQLAIGLGAAGIGRLKLDASLSDREHFEQSMRMNSGGGHQIGTTRMSTSIVDGVVDANCKVHGIDNLFCAGSSVFPTTSWINPTMTISALALRLADHLADRATTP